MAKRNYQGHVYLLLAISSITVGPVLLMYRARQASLLETWIYITLFIPLGFLVMVLNYTRELTQAGECNEPEVRKSLTGKVRAKYFKYLLFYIPCTLAYAGISLWILGRGGL